MVGVLLQLSTDNVLSDSLWEQIADNLPSLFPALLFCIYPRTALMSLAALRDENERGKREEAARTIQAFLRRKGHGGLAALGDVAVDLITDAHQSTAGSSSHSQTRRQWCCPVEYLNRHREACFVSTTGSVAFLLGVMLIAHVGTAIQRQEKKCTAVVGGIATCMRPRRYFLKDGIFGETECFFEHVATANCSGSNRLEEFVPDTPEAVAVYRNMSKLTVINVSGVPQLRGVPRRSWSQIPNLKVLDASGCNLFEGLPFDLCAKTSIELMNLDGTLAQKSLNWSGQLKHVIGAGRKPTLSTACASALTKPEQPLRELVLSDNNISLGTRGLTDAHECHKERRTSPVDASEIEFVKTLTAISRLVLSHNQIEEISGDYFKMTQFVYSNLNGRVELQGNPIRVLSMPIRQFTNSDRAASIIVQSVRANPQSGLLSCFRIEVPASFDGGLPSFVGFPNLTIIRVNNGNVTSIAPQAFASLHKTLTRLFLSANPLTSIDPATFSRLSGLVELKLQNNKLTLIDPQTFSGLSNLQQLHLGNNQLTSIAPQTFSGLSNLHELNLNRNELTSIEPRTFADLHKLRRLHLHGNQLTSIDDPHMFSGLIHLERLDVRWNRLTSIAPQALAGLPSSLKMLVLYEGNDLDPSQRDTWGLDDAVWVK